MNIYHARLGAAICVLLISTQAFSQARGDFGPTISGANQTLGYKGPAFGATGHVVTRHDRFGFEGSASWLHAPKAQTNDGSQFKAVAALRFYVKPRVFIDAGFTAAHQSTSLYRKGGAGPLGGIGYDDGITTVQFTYDRLLDENKSDGFTFSAERLVRLSERGFLSFRPFAEFARFDTPHSFDGINRRESGARAGVTVGIGRQR